MISTIIILAITITVVEVLGLSLNYQAWLANGRKHNDYTLITRNVLLALPLMYFMLVLIIGLVP